jgi:hypothetical protein
MRLEEEKHEEKARIEAEKERLQQLEKVRLEALEKIAGEQAKEKNLIKEEKQRLVELEKKHANSMKVKRKQTKVFIVVFRYCVSLERFLSSVEPCYVKHTDVALSDVHLF